MLARADELERLFPDLVVIGVHAGKYPRERRTEAVRTACQRLGVHHPVVNDRHLRTWRAYAVNAWPTVALVGADGRIIGQQSGEFEVGPMAETIRRAQEEYRSEGLLIEGPYDPGVDPLMPREPTGTLRYPGRVLAADGRLYVSDTGHDRVLETRLERVGTGWRARVERTFGDGEPGFQDGPANQARFQEPQGLALWGGRLYVADRRNHAIREAVLSTGEMRTIAGNGELGGWRIDEGPGLQTSLRSPWGLAVADTTLYITMAGSHQLWSLGLADAEHGLLPAAGTGAENIVDGPALSATLAQPMGCAIAEDGSVFIADAESSAVRRLRGGEVTSVIGEGLFEHGDRDGIAGQARLQHDQDLTVLGRDVIVADTYNDKLKRVDPRTRECVALPGEAGSGEALNEPQGICAYEDGVFVADTDAHRVVWVTPETGEVREVELG